jgi:two-component system, OmpR family, sensor histidine kinase ChvG
MKLAGQLLAVSAVTLLLPWAGCQYAREVEGALRDTEAQALLATARLFGAALGPAIAMRPPERERWAATRGRGLDVYLHPLPLAPTLDGFVEDWGAAAAAVERLGGLELAAGQRGAFVYLFAITAGSRAPAAVLITGRDAVADFPLEAPGPVTAAVHGAPADPRARGYWQATSRGWQLEARLPASLLAGRVGIEVLEPDGSVRAASFHDTPGWTTGPDPALQAALEEIAPPGLRVHVTDRAGFVLASRQPETTSSADRAAGWLKRVYRAVLGERMSADPLPTARRGQLAGRHLELAALGEPAARRYALPGDAGLWAAAAPAGAPGDPAALVVVERESAEILSLTRAPTRRLLAASLLASVLATAVLLGFAAWLSWRIRRLRDAAGAAIDGRGAVSGAFPGNSARDELGDLARSFGGLLGRVGEHNRYLQELGGRLAHELRTPLAVVRGSLDNLEAEGAARGPWLARARGGVDRMSGLINALAGAQRMERAVTAAEHERFDLAGHVEGMLEAYRALHPERAFPLQRPTGACRVDGAPELVAQMLDKLIENAIDFAPPGALIRVAIADAGAHWRLSVANPGSRLPPGPPARLFDSLVSGRRMGAGAHLGLGLYIVRLVAEHHGGRATARNLPEDAGVEFAVELPKADESTGRARP